MSFERALAFVLEQEGGYVNDPKDPGGETMCGISKRSYPHLDIQNLTEPEIREIYRRDFWDAMHGDVVPPALAFVLFDAAVQHGQPATVMLLQFALGFRGPYVDGIFGSGTLTAIQTVLPNYLIAEFVARRMLRYSQNPNTARFGLGWFRRLARCHQEALSL